MLYNCIVVLLLLTQHNNRTGLSFTEIKSEYHSRCHSHGATSALDGVYIPGPRKCVARASHRELYPIRVSLTSHNNLQAIPNCFINLDSHSTEYPISGHVKSRTL